MKYVVKWNNGYWKVFNTEKYTDVSVHLLMNSAQDHADSLNQGKE